MQALLRATPRASLSCSLSGIHNRSSWLPNRPPAGSAAARRQRQRQSAAAAAAQQQQQQQQHPPAGAAAAAAAAAGAALLLAAGPALALDIRMEPENALSLPTWAIHTSSVLEWVTAMGLM